MIFSLKQGMYTSVLLGNKTMTTRLKLPAHIRKGAVWAIVPGRAKAAWWLGYTHGQPRVLTNTRTFDTTVDHYLWDVEGVPIDMFTASERKRMARDYGLVQAAIVIDDFYQSPLGDMDDADGKNEGCGGLVEFVKVWSAINPKIPFSFNMDKLVWRIRFHRADGVRELVERIGSLAILDAAAMQTAKMKPTAVIEAE